MEPGRTYKGNHMCEDADDAMELVGVILKDGRRVTMREYSKLMDEEDRQAAEAKAKADAAKKPVKPMSVKRSSRKKSG